MDLAERERERERERKRMRENNELQPCTSCLITIMMMVIWNELDVVVID